MGCCCWCCGGGGGSGGGGGGGGRVGGWVGVAVAVAVCLRWGMYELICGSGLGVDDERITIER